MRLERHGFPIMRQLRQQKTTCFRHVVFSIFGITAAIFSTRPLLGHLSSLMRSDYEYSAITHNPVGEDCYFQYNAGIRFALTGDSDVGINSDVVMKSDRSEYTDIIYWNAGRLGPRDIAVSKNVARAYELSVGDTLFSKHLVDGEIYEYTIRELLPELVNVRFDGQHVSHDGVIVMGFNQQYEENISHNIVLFSRIPIDELAQSISEMPDHLLHRSEEMASVFQKAAPYLIVFFLVSVLITIGMVFYCSKAISYNFNSLIRLGTEETRLNRSYNKIVYSVGVVSILVAFLVSTIILSVRGICVAATVYIAFMLLGDLITLLCATNRKIARIGKYDAGNIFQKTLNHMEHFARSRAMVKWKGRNG